MDAPRKPDDTRFDEARNGPAREVGELIRRLLEHSCREADPSRRDDMDLEQIVLDVDVDGLRYLLVRLPRPDRSQIVLSPREHEIARMVAKGHHNKTIAGVLNISSWTVCTHLRRIFAKLGVNSRAAMVARLLEMDIVREKPQPSAWGAPGIRAGGESALFGRTDSELDEGRPAPEECNDRSVRNVLKIRR